MITKFNLKKYKTADHKGNIDDVQTNPDLMSKMDPSTLELFNELRTKHPELSLKDIIDILRKKKLLPMDKPEFPSQQNIIKEI